MDGQAWRLLVCSMAALLTGCGSGTFGILAASDSSSSSGNAPSSIGELTVEDRKVPEAVVMLEVADAESNPAEVELLYQVPGGLLTPFATLPENPLTLATTPDGFAKSLMWDFAGEADLPDDARFVDDVLVMARVVGGKAELEVQVGLGNDAPVVTDVTVPLVDEAVGIVAIPFCVEDTSDDVISIYVEYNADAASGYPESSWSPARPGGIPAIAATPDPAFVGIEAPRTGRCDLVFFWDTDHATQLPDLERDVMLRFTAEDSVLTGPTFVTPAFHVDNNAVPIAQIDSGPLILNPDQRRGIPIPFRVIDEEGDLVDVILQWRREGEEFPPLPSGTAALDALLADPALRRESHICTPYPHYAQGRVVSIDSGAADTVRLPELAAGESWILAGGLTQRALELLRPSSHPLPITPNWAANPLNFPVAALPLGDGRTALVLDVPGSGRLREVDLATGAIKREVATLGRGIPSGMAFEAGEAAVVVALNDAGTWRIERADLSSGAVTELMASDGSQPGPVRGVASLGTKTLLFTAGPSLLQLDYRCPLLSQTGSQTGPQLGRLLTDLATPSGVVVDPQHANRIYVSERDADRVLAIELDSQGGLATVVRTADLQLGTLQAPERLALERNGARLLIDTSAPGGGRQLMGLDLGATGGNVSFPIGDPTTTDVAGVATGPDGLRLVCLPAANELLVAGGVEQQRVIASYSSSAHEVSAQTPFSPAPSPGQPWRVAEENQRRLRASAQGIASVFLWDSSDAQSGRISFRVTARDDESSVPADGAAPKPVRAGLEVEPLMLGDAVTTYWPFDVLAADIDGDGSLDIVSANLGGMFDEMTGEPLCGGPADGDNLTVFFQDSPGSFATQRSPLLLGDSAMDGPRAVAAADIDGDGAMDLVSANYCSNNLTVFFQDPSTPGSFQATTLGDDATTNGPASVAVADLDGDGVLDIVSANLDVASSSLVVFFQDPLLPRSFAGARPPLEIGGLAVTNQPASVAAGDLDGDGDLDLVCANSFGGPVNASSFDGNLTVFLQDSPGSFATIPITLGSSETTRSPRSVVAADLDRDGDLDLVSANRRGSDLTVFFQRAPGDFDPTPLTLGGFGITNQPFSVAAADIDGDGGLDILSANAASDNVTVFLQESPGSFATMPLIVGSPTTTYTAASVAAADLDGDGDLDLVTANDDPLDQGGLPGGPGNLAVFAQFSPGSFAADPLTLGGVGDTNSPWSPTAADLDGDGDLDLVMANPARDNLAIFFQLAPGNFALLPETVGSSATIDGPNSVAAADFDGDGDLDLVSANRFSNNLSIFYQLSPGSFAATPVFVSSAAMSEPFALAVADLDGDGSLDLVSANRSSNNLTVFFQDPLSPGSFTAAPPLGGSVNTNGVRSVAAADLDGDGALDLVCANQYGNNLTIFFQDPLSPGSFGDRIRVGGPTTTNRPFSVAAADLDGDGDLDLVSANSASDDLTIFFQLAPRDFALLPETVGGSELMDAPRWVSAADLDRDGDLDLVCANRGSRDLLVFFQLAPGSFGETPLRLDSGGSFPTSVAAADLDGDGDPDLVLANEGSLSTRGNLMVFFGGR